MRGGPEAGALEQSRGSRPRLPASCRGRFLEERQCAARPVGPRGVPLRSRGPRDRASSGGPPSGLGSPLRRGFSSRAAPPQLECRPKVMSLVIPTRALKLSAEEPECQEERWGVGMGLCSPTGRHTRGPDRSWRRTRVLGQETRRGGQRSPHTRPERLTRGPRAGTACSLRGRMRTGARTGALPWRPAHQPPHVGQRLAPSKQEKPESVT